MPFEPPPQDGACPWEPVADMPRTEPAYTREQVNAAWNLLIDCERLDDWDRGDAENYEYALLVISNWRSSHSYPLTNMRINLRNNARRVDPTFIVAQRIKRLSSIANKLHLQPTMRLSQMQDIGGCRAVVRSVSRVRQINGHYETTRARHTLATVDDYISRPKSSGYRGIHLVYKYFSDTPANAVFNGLKIEIQLRSLYQHAWATAVETVGTFVGQALKSSIGEREWLRFFQLMGTVIAMREKSPIVPNTPGDRKELIKELRHYATTMNVDRRLRVYRTAMRAVRSPSVKDAVFYLLKLDSGANRLEVTGFPIDQWEIASDKYLEAERMVKDHPGTDAVLVSVDSLTALAKAYPNYFADTRVFLALLDQGLSGKQRRIFVGALSLEDDVST